MEKKKVLVSYAKLPPSVLELVKETYPDGVKDSLTKIPNAKGGFFYAFTLEADDVIYLVKVNRSSNSELDYFDDIDATFTGKDIFEAN